MNPLKIVETGPDRFSLLLDVEAAPVFDVIRELGHEPNGYFWEGIAELLISSELPDLNGEVELDPEAGMFCARADDRQMLETLGARMADVATDPKRLRQLVALARESGFQFDD